MDWLPVAGAIVIGLVVGWVRRRLAGMSRGVGIDVAALRCER